MIYLQRPADAPAAAYLFDGVVSHPVDLPGMNFSEVVKLPAGDLTLGMTAQSVASPDSFPNGAPTVKIPGSITDLYLIVVHDPDNRVFPVRLLPLNVSTDKLKPGQAIWLNMTPHQIEAKLGKESLALKPGARAVGNAPLAGNGYYKAQFAYKPQGETSLLPIMEKSWWHDDNSKYLGFIIDSGGRLPKVFMFRDFRDPLAAQAQGETE